MVEEDEEQGEMRSRRKRSREGGSTMRRGVGGSGGEGGRYIFSLFVCEI